MGARLVRTSHDDDAAGERSWISPKILGQRQLGIRDLTLPGPARELVVALIKHTQTARPDRMAEILQPAVGVYRKVSVQAERAAIDLLGAGAWSAGTGVFQAGSYSKTKTSNKVYNPVLRFAFPGVLG